MDNTETLKKVLIVDDEEDMIWSLQKNLNNDKLQVDITVASSGEDALQVLSEKPIDLVVTDIKMPGISGIDLLMRISNRYPNTGVVVMTAFPSPEHKNEALAHGGLHYLEKPFDINELRRVIKTSLAQDDLFKGTVSGIELSDIIQINCLSKSSTTLRVKTSSGREGRVYFYDGNIIHAQCGTLSPEEAFYEILTFKGGMIECISTKELPERTIKKDTEALLLEGMARMDELKAKQNEEKISISSSASDSMPGNIDVISDNKNEEEIMNDLKNLLTEFTSLPGVNTACLVGRDGFLLDSIAIAGTDSEMIGAIASGGFGASESMGNQLDKGSLTMTMIEYDQGPVMLAPIGSEAFLVVVADKEANLGMIRLKIKKHAGEIEKSASI
ncbi:MAG: response regulator [Desulfobulbaceae bacterium]|nr:response regulator [Desulfobulbaceae bacterium]